MAISPIPYWYVYKRLNGESISIGKMAKPLLKDNSYDLALKGIIFLFLIGFLLYVAVVIVKTFKSGM